MSPERHSGWELEFRDSGGNSLVMAAVYWGKMERGGVKEETVVGYACAGKPGSHESKAISPSHM